MASSRPTNHRRQRRQRHPSISSDGSSASVGDENVGTDSEQRPLTTPRTKRRSITHLSELVRRQKEEHSHHRRHTTHASDGVTPEQIERKMESLLVPPPPSVQTPTRERRLIQVAVRCRPRKSMRVTRQGVADGSDGSDGSDDGDADDDDTDDDDEDDIALSDSHDGASHDQRQRLPLDSVLVYDIPDVARSRLPAISVPSHVLALGGHGPRRRFEFDGVFPPWMQQRDVYDATAFEAIEEVLGTAQRRVSSGSNATAIEPAATTAAHATVVAYGQTGTGKTYTMGMLQHADTATRERDHGIIPRAVLHVLTRIRIFNHSEESKRNGIQLEASMSFLQIYLETIQDLLVPPGRVSHTGQASGERRASMNGAPATPIGLPVRLDPVTHEFYVAGLSEFPVADVADARTLLELAAHNRVLAATTRNKTSSRSHTLLTISIKHRRARHGDARDDEADDDRDANNDERPPCTVSFVDLAGSERVEGALHFLHATRKRQELRIREAKFINRSLSALGSVIAALSAQDERRTKPFVASSTMPHVVGSRSTRRFGSPQSPSGTSTAATVAAGTPHIRFRDSQLTKLLQARLMNGHGRLILIATIDDRPGNLTETLSTLKFAAQCRRVDLSQRRSTAEAVRKQREETLLKQVFAEVKATYDAREAALHKQYEARIEALEHRLRNVSSDSHESPRPNAAYVALCSLVDMAQQKQEPHRSVVQEHPPLESFAQASEQVAYVADLYRQLKEALQSSDEKASESSNASRPRRPSRAADCSIDSTEPTQADVVKTTSAVSYSVSPRRADDVLSGSAMTAAADESEFQLLARFMFTSGMLGTIAVSSDEEDGEPHSQLK